jgi:hypothetical protein
MTALTDNLQQLKIAKETIEQLKEEAMAASLETAVWGPWLTPARPWVWDLGLEQHFFGFTR